MKYKVGEKLKAITKASDIRIGDTITITEILLHRYDKPTYQIQINKGQISQRYVYYIDNEKNFTRIKVVNWEKEFES